MNRVLGAALVSAGLFLATPTFAQSNTGCSAQGTDAERIACLEARIDALEQALSRQGVVDAPAPPASEGAESASPAPVEPAETFGAEQLEAAPVAAAAATTAAPAAREGRRWLRMPNIPFFGDEDEDQSAPTELAAAPSEPAAAPMGVQAFGAEQVAERNDARDMNPRDEAEEILRANIVDFQELHRGRLVVALDNGQMWRQMDVDSRKVRLREGETYPVEIRRSGFGGYRMKVADNDRIMSVERLR